MPFEQKQEINGVYSKFTGIVTALDIHQSDGLVLNNQGFEHLIYIISDFLEAEKVELTEDDLKRIAGVSSSMARLNDKLLVAVAVKEFDKHLAEKWQTFLSKENPGWNIKICNSLSVARTWISSNI